MNNIINNLPIIMEAFRSIALALFLIFIGYIVIRLYTYYIDIKTKKEIFDRNMRERIVELKVLETKIKESEAKIKSSDNKIRRIEDSLKLTNFIKEIASQMVVLKFKTFKDNHDILKVSEESVKNLVREIAIDVRKSIKYYEIDFDSLILSQQFYDEYIVNTVVMLTKNILDKTINEYEEGE